MTASLRSGGTRNRFGEDAKTGSFEKHTKPHPWSGGDLGFEVNAILKCLRKIRPLGKRDLCHKAQNEIIKVMVLKYFFVDIKMDIKHGNGN